MVMIGDCCYFAFLDRQMVLVAVTIVVVALQLLRVATIISLHY